MILLSLTIILIIGTYIYIHIEEKKKKNLLNSAKFIFTIGLLATFLGFVLATYATDLQNESNQKQRAISILESSIDISKNELKLIKFKGTFLESYLNGKIDQHVLYSIIVDDNTNNLFSGNEDTYSYFSETFKSNLPLINAYIKNLFQFYDPTGDQEKDLILLKEICGAKYLKIKMMEEELTFLNGDKNPSEIKQSIESIMKEQLSNILIKAMRNDPIDEIVPQDYFNKD